MHEVASFDEYDNNQTDIMENDEGKKASFHRAQPWMTSLKER